MFPRSAAASPSSALAAHNLRQVIRQFFCDGQAFTLLTDDGSENQGALTQLVLNSQGQIQHRIAQIDIRQSNSMIETVNKKLKYGFLFRDQPPDFQTLQVRLPDIIAQ